MQFSKVSAAALVAVVALVQPALATVMITSPVA
jgi:hypothetical protein